MTDSLQGKRILVPASRVSVNVLARMLARIGADVVVFPELRGAPPTDAAALVDAAGRLGDWDWVVFSGELAARAVADRLGGAGAGDAPAFPAGLRVGAIGAGATAALKHAGIAVDYAPREHTAAEVTGGMGDLSGRRVLLVRAEGAATLLPSALRAAGAEVTDVPGFRVIVEASRTDAEALAARALDALAFASPSAVRLLDRAARATDLDLGATLGNAVIGAVGPATAQTAREHGLEPDLVSAGRLADFVRDLTARLTR